MNSEYQEKLQIKTRLDKYYLQQSRKNGLTNMNKVKIYMPPQMQFLHLKRGLVFAHLDFESVLALIAQNKPFSVVSGLNPSSQLHIGHLVLFMLLIELQKLGAEVYIPLTDDESYVDGKVNSITESNKKAHEEVIPVIQNLGFDKKRTHVSIDTDNLELYRFAMSLSKHVSMAQITSLFGKESLQNPGQVFYRGCIQLAQILMPQLPKFGGPRPTLIPVGPDQHPYVLLARDIAKKIKMIPPSEIVIKFLPSLIHPEKKMSKSKPLGVINIDDEPQAINRKINKSYSGAMSSLKLHQELGGIPEACSVFAIYNAFEPEDAMVKEMYTRYIRGDLLASELKIKTGKMLTNILNMYK